MAQHVCGCEALTSWLEARLGLALDWCWAKRQALKPKTRRFITTRHSGQGHRPHSMGVGLPLGKQGVQTSGKCHDSFSGRCKQRQTKTAQNPTTDPKLSELQVCQRGRREPSAEFRSITTASAAQPKSAPKRTRRQRRRSLCPCSKETRTNWATSSRSHQGFNSCKGGIEHAFRPTWSSLRTSLRETRTAQEALEL